MEKYTTKLRDRVDGDFDSLSYSKRSNLESMILSYDKGSPLYKLWFDRVWFPEKYKEIEAITKNESISKENIKLFSSKILTKYSKYPIDIGDKIDNNSKSSSFADSQEKALISKTLLINKIWGITLLTIFQATLFISYSIKKKNINMNIIRLMLGVPATLSTVYIYYKYIWIKRIENRLKAKYATVLPAYSGDFSQQALNLLFEEEEEPEKDKKIL